MRRRNLTRGKCHTVKLSAMKISVTKFLVSKFLVAKFSEVKFPAAKFPAVKSPSTKFIAVKMSSGEISGGEICSICKDTAKIFSFQPLQINYFKYLKSNRKFNNFRKKLAITPFFRI